MAVIEETSDSKWASDVELPAWLPQRPDQLICLCPLSVRVCSGYLALPAALRVTCCLPGYMSAICFAFSACSAPAPCLLLVGGSFVPRVLAFGLASSTFGRPRPVPVFGTPPGLPLHVEAAALGSSWLPTAPASAAASLPRPCLTARHFLVRAAHAGAHKRRDGGPSATARDEKQSLKRFIDK